MKQQVRIELAPNGARHRRGRGRQDEHVEGPAVVITFEPPIMDGDRPLILVVAQDSLDASVLSGLIAEKKPEPPSRDPDPSTKRNRKARQKALELLRTDEIDQIARNQNLHIGMLSRDELIQAIIQNEFK